MGRSVEEFKPTGIDYDVRIFVSKEKLAKKQRG